MHRYDTKHGVSVHIYQDGGKVIVPAIDNGIMARSFAGPLFANSLAEPEAGLSRHQSPEIESVSHNRAGVPQVRCEMARWW